MNLIHTASLAFAALAGVMLSQSAAAQNVQPPAAWSFAGKSSPFISPDDATWGR